MLNKELLLIPKAGKDYTHVVLVGADRTLYGFLGSDGIGAINPTFLDIGASYPLKIYELSSTRGSTYLTVGGLLSVSSLYLGRADIKTLVPIRPSEIAPGGATFDGELFDFNDLDKEIPIWLGTTPPPWA